MTHVVVWGYIYTWIYVLRVKKNIDSIEILIYIYGHNHHNIITKENLKMLIKARYVLVKYLWQF